MGVTHVIDPLCPAGGSWRGVADATLLDCADTLRAHAADRCIVLGPRAAGDRAHALGIASFWRVPLCRPRPSLSGPLLRAQLGAIEPDASLVAWSDRAGEVCEAARAPGGWSRAVEFPLSVPNSGFAPCSVDRAATRLRLGVQDDQCLILLLCPSPARADARAFAFLVGLLDVSGLRVAGLVDRVSSQIARARAFHRDARVAWPLLIPEEPALALLGACDLAAYVPGAHGPSPRGEEMQWLRMSVRRAHAAGVPVASTGGGAHEELYPSELRGMLIGPSSSPSDMARRVSVLAGDRGARARAASGVRAHVAGRATGRGGGVPALRASS